MPSYQLTLSSKVRFGVDSVFIDGVDVVFGRLQRSELRAQMTVLAAVGTSGAWKPEGMWKLAVLVQRWMYPCKYHNDYKLSGNAAKM